MRSLVLVSGLLGAAILIAAELTPLAHVRVVATSAPIKTVPTGAHNGYALIPIAALSAALTVSAVRYRRRSALIGLGLLGLVALLIALVGDLPDAQATGLLGSSTTRYVFASASPAIGLYLETLGSVLLLFGSGLGLLITTPPDGARWGARWFAS